MTGTGTPPSPFRAWPKTPRLFRDMVVTEKIDGTNAAVGVCARHSPELNLCTIDDLEDAGYMYAGAVGGEALLVWAQSRNRTLTPGTDNAGFRAWVETNAYSLARTLGPGLHFGEWWGNGIQRGYGMQRKHFSLFDTTRWTPAALRHAPGLDVVPVLYEGPFDTPMVSYLLDELSATGSSAAPGYLNPEGVIVCHSASRRTFKALIEGDAVAKSEVVAASMARHPSALQVVTAERWADLTAARLAEVIAAVADR